MPARTLLPYWFEFDDTLYFGRARSAVTGDN